MSFKRARSENQIKDRIQEIVNAASIVYNSVGYEGLSFSAISEYTNFTRPNIYKYFNTKEEILLLIMIKDFKSWILTVSKSFKINKLYSVYEIGEIWVEIAHTQGGFFKDPKNFEIVKGKLEKYKNKTFKSL